MELEEAQAILNRLMCKVRTHMGWDEEKAYIWFFTSNPLLGGVKPYRMIRVGRHEKLERFIDSCIEENSPGAKASQGEGG